MGIDFEGRLWQKASQVFGIRLQSLVEEGIDSFKRQPGLDDPTRVYTSLIGLKAFEALGGALDARGLLESHWGARLPCDPLASQAAVAAPSAAATDAYRRNC